MEQRQLGRTDLRVSALCLGVMTFGEQNTEQQAYEQLDMVFEHGVNFIDTAEMYPSPARAETSGESERIVGNCIITATTLAQLREDLGSIAVELSQDVLDGIEAIHESRPNPCP